ncbi:MAG: glycosyltransferase family 4 protein [Patescibacteria group bacterium]|nr:glycosyltransferase family 4 protein [Patescibacteria group bacterium]
MKILQVVQRFYPSVGGTQNVVLNLSQELVKKGHQVTVVTTNSMNNKDVRGFSTARSFTFKSNLSKLPEHEKINGIDVYRFAPIWQFWSYLINFKMFWFIWKNAKKYDVIHTYCYMFSEPDIVALTNIFKKVPYILSAHDIIASAGGLAGFLKKIYDLTIGKIVLRRAMVLTALTEANKNEYLNLGNFKNIQILPPGMYCEKFQNRIELIRKNLQEISRLKTKINNPKHTVLFVGRLLKYKGAQYIIEAIPEIISKFPETKFIFIGEDQGYKKSLVSIAQIKNVEKYCVFTGKISDQELYEYYSISDIFVLPSATEGFGIVALEATLSGMSPILANQGGLKYVLSDIGGININIESNIPKQISKSVIELINNKNKLNILNLQNKIKQKFDWQNIVNQTEKIYQETIK